MPAVGEEEEESDGEAAELPLAAADVPDMPAPAQMPSLEEYKSKWEAKLRFHSRECPGGFSLKNLVPKPVPRLDAIHALPTFAGAYAWMALMSVAGIYTCA